MRILVFFIILYLSTLITNSYSDISDVVGINFTYQWPQIFLLFIGFYLIQKRKKYDNKSNSNLQWCIPLAKFSLIISFVILVLTFNISGRDEKLHEISSNLLLYYLSITGSGIIMVIISALLQPTTINLSKRTFFYIISSILFFSLTNLSRTLAFYFLIAILIAKIHLDMPKRKIISLSLVLVICMIVMPILQGRTDNIYGAVERSILNIIFYISYSFYLGDHLINQGGLSGISWGYFGYLFTKLINEPLDSNIFFDQKLLYEFVNIGTSDLYGSLNANVMYPLWATVYYDYGNYSFIFYIVLFLFIIFTYKFNLTLLFSWLYFRFVVIGFLVSPLLLRDMIIETIIVFIVQFYIIHKKTNEN
ncbi:hypothetical protein ACQFZT_003578 [Providencia stuartii]